MKIIKRRELTYDIFSLVVGQNKDYSRCSLLYKPLGGSLLVHYKLAQIQ